MASGEKLGDAYVEVHADTTGAAQEVHHGLLSPLKALGAVAAAGLAVGVKKGAEALTRAVGRASDLNETLNKSRTIFPNMSRSLESWANHAVTRMGLTKGQALANTSQFGDMFRQLKIGERPAAAMSKSMVTLAADFASFHNADITEVLLAQQSAFRGEYDALQRFVPGINAARVEQEALNATHKSSAKDLTNAEKAQAAYNIMLKDGARARGDYLKTAKEQANQERTLKAQVESLSGAWGQRFLPAVNAVTRSLTESLMPQLSKLEKEHGPAVERTFTKAGEKAADFIRHLDLSDAAAKFTSGLEQARLGVEAFFAAGFGGEGITTESGTLVGTMERLGVKAKELSDSFRSASQDGPSLSQNLGALSDAASVAGVTVGFLADHTDLLAQALPALVVAYGLVKGAQAAANLAAVADVVLMPARIASNFALASSLRAVAAANAGGAGAAAVNAAAMNATGTAASFSALGALRAAAAWLASRAAMVAGAVATGLVTAAQWALNVALTANPIGLVVAAIAIIVIALIRWYKTSERARTIINGVWQGIVSGAKAMWAFLVSAWQGISAAIAVGAGRVRNTLTNMRAAAIAIWNALWAATIGRAISAGAQLYNAISGAGNRITGFFRSLPGRILGALGNLGSLLFNAGANIVQGLINGITSRIGAVASAASRLASTVRNFLPFSPAKEGPLSGRGSPERAGRRIAQNLAAGMLRGRRELKSAAGSLLGGAGLAAGFGPRGPATAGGPVITMAPGAVQVSVSGSGSLTGQQVEIAVARALDDFRRQLTSGRVA